MKDSKEKEHRISNLKDMIDNVGEEEVNENFGFETGEDIEEDEELINFLNENTEDYEIDDEYIYRPGNDDIYAVNLEEDNEIDENFIIETNINEKLDQKAQVVKKPDDEEYEDNFENFLNFPSISKKPIFPIIGIILGIIFIIVALIVFSSGTDRIIDNVVSGENQFLTVVLMIIGILLLIYGIFSAFHIKSPFDNMMNSINDIEEEKETLKKVEDKKDESVVPKSNIPLDKESYKIGEFDMNELKNNLKQSFSKTVKTPEDETIAEEEINVEDLPPAREKPKDKKGLIKEEIEEMDYEQAQLEGESIDEIFANVEDLPEDKEK